jgi:hypothetical protein
MGVAFLRVIAMASFFNESTRSQMFAFCAAKRSNSNCKPSYEKSPALCYSHS